jgi:hypothetical protein
MTKQERDLAIVRFFAECINGGMRKMEATRKTQQKFGFLTDVPIYNARRRVADINQRKEAGNG